MKYFMKYFKFKNFMKFYNTTCGLLYFILKPQSVDLDYSKCLKLASVFHKDLHFEASCLNEKPEVLCISSPVV